MSIGGTLFFLGALLITGILIALPLLGRERRTQVDTARIEKQRERLLVYYERVLTNLRDLDEDHATDKMQDAAYAAEREDWMLRGVQVLKAIDTLEEQSIIPTDIRDDAGVDEAIDDTIEASIAAYRNAREPQG